MEIIKPPQQIRLIRNEPAFFLAGSIEMGAAQPWQKEAEERLNCYYPKTGFILNPRRDDWDSSWSQNIDNPHFREQVNWELSALEQCDVIGMYIDPNTKSPITLLEFGMYARSGKLVVCCPTGFYRKGNIDIVCERYGVQQVYINVASGDNTIGLSEFVGAMSQMYESRRA